MINSRSRARMGALKKSTATIACLAAAFAVTGGVAAQSSDSDDEEVEEVVVTGSRISTDSTTALASPVQVISIENFKRSGELDVGQTLRETPALTGSDPAALDTAQGFALSGASTLDLRSLGTDRTLVLQDGRRHVPGLAGTATVDVGSIPQALIKSVEVLTGGASAVYGADAVSGVVNFITRTGRDFDGIEYRAQTGISDKGDAEEVFVSIAGGGEFQDGRGSAVFAVEYNNSTGLLNGDRPKVAGPGFSSLAPSNAFLNGQLGLAADSQFAFVPNRRLPVSSSAGTIALDPTPFAFPFGALNSYVFDFDPTTDTVPTIPGTDIPVLQIIDPETGQLRGFNPGISTGAFNASGGDGIFIASTAPGHTLIPGSTRIVASSGFDYELTEGVTFFSDAKFSYVETSNTAGLPFSDDVPIALDNPFIPQELQNQIQVVDALIPGTSPSIFIARDNDAALFGGGTDVERSTIRASGGFRGEIPGTTLNFEVSYSWGRTNVDSVNRRSRINDRYFTAIDAVALTEDDLNGTNALFAFGGGGSATLNAIRNGQDIVIDAGSAQVGDIVCRAELTGTPSPAALFVGGPPLYAPGTTINGEDVGSLTRPVTFQIGDGQCAPINVLGQGAIQGAGRDFAFVDLENDTTIEQQQFLAFVSGDTEGFVELPGGPIGFAAGFEWRRDASLFVPNAFFSIEPNVVTNNAATILRSPTNGQGIEVSEGYAELRLPLLADLPFAQYLEVTLAGRLSEYNTIGTTETYSIGSTYKPVDWLTLRGTYSRAVRAPNIGELFAPQAAATIGVPDDPCSQSNINNGTANRITNCAEFVGPDFEASNFLTAFVTGTTGGNPNLTEEISDSFTLGAIFEPRGLFGGALDNLVVIADYYDIEISQAVGSLTGAAIARACVDLPSTDNQFCDSIQRDPNNGGAISGFTSGNINLTELRARGIDFEVRYNFDIADGDWGNVLLSAQGTHFLERFTESDPIIAQTIAAETDPLQQALLIADQATVSDLLGVVGVPEWIVNFSANWQYDAWTVGWRGRFVNSTNQLSNARSTNVEIVGNEVVTSVNSTLLDPSQFATGDSLEHDLTVSYDFEDEGIQIYGGINNLTDRRPFLNSRARPVSPRGRFFFLGVSGSF